MSVKPFFSDYLKGLVAVSNQGDAREESFYGTLSKMLGEVAKYSGRHHVRVTTLPKPTDAGNPDFRLWNGKDRIIGYIEAKKPSEQRLDLIENTEQLKRYRATFPNLILTNFLEFRFYRNGDLFDTVAVARPLVFGCVHSSPPIEKPEELYSLIDRFLDFSIPKAFSAETLAVDLAKRTRFLRDLIEQQVIEEESTPGSLFGFFEAFKSFLISTLTPEDFADLFAQTITYGLFASRTRSKGDFNRGTAFDNIPHTIGILRDLFRFISLGELPDQLAWCIDDIAEVLAVADAPGILDTYYHERKGSDPIVHFYETFLAQYDPGERERRGVYYTPEPVVSYIVRSLNEILKTDFEKPEGLASEGVTLLDPAAGTMTFLAKAAQVAVGEFESRYGSGAREEFVRKHILKNFYAFELMMAPYAVGHLKMGFFLEELGHRLVDDERIPFYLTNTLDFGELEHSLLPGFSALAEESRLAGVVKKQTPVLVILGNPPYSGHSSNKGEWISGLIDDYKQVDGKPLGEKNPKWLQDDYVKFIRFAQWKIDQAGSGVVGIITNHSYLDNPTFRGMRQSLMKTFDEIRIIDLHGNSLKKETSPDGSPDQNVFDIRQGVAIAFFLKRGNGKEAVVMQSDLRGARETKYAWLESHSLESTEWTSLNPSTPSYLFVPHNDLLDEVYRRFPSLQEIFPLNSVGIVTARDGLTIHPTADKAWQTVGTFSRMEPELAREGYRLGKDSNDWKVDLAQKDLLDSGPNRNNIVPILYRPLDIRYTYYTGRSGGFICRPRPEVMKNMLAGENLGILVPKRVEYVGSWQHVFVCDSISDHVAVSLKTIDYHFPLFIYSFSGHSDIFSSGDLTERKPNLSPTLMKTLTGAFGCQPPPEEVFGYVYAILYAPAYREKYKELLKMDFPRVPFTGNVELFAKLAKLGGRLWTLHLLSSSELDTSSCRFEGEGNGLIGKSRGEEFRYEEESARVYINENQHFAPVSVPVWEYRIGGYQVCLKWLKDRIGTKMELDDIRTYCRIVTALGKTIDIQREIDALYPEAERTAIEG